MSAYSPAIVLRATADAIGALPAGALVHKVVLKNATTTAVASVVLNHGACLTAAQTHADYDNNATTEGVFTGGIDYDAADTITLGNGAIITVGAVDDDPINGVVTEFTVTSAGSALKSTSTPALTQSTTSGEGSGFILSPDTGNMTQTGTTTFIEVITDEVTDATAEQFARTAQQDFTPPVFFGLGASVDVTGTSAVAYVYYTLS